ncbi:MAG TPA: energy transducer TonB [Candidatus Solibacter sp.]|jgi:TonB family protein|nr:energy transducer TonB [Candidatus Solibacter sp.]
MSNKKFTPGLLGRTVSGFMLLGIFGLQSLSGIQSPALTDTKTETKQSRKLKSGQPPEYPELARRMNIRGIARVMVTISADGVVKEVKELGGHPLLIDALTRAVKRWKYEPAAKESVIEVKAEFGT